MRSGWVEPIFNLSQKYNFGQQKIRGCVLGSYWEGFSSLTEIDTRRALIFLPLLFTFRQRSKGHMPGVAAAILELWEEALPALPPSLLYFSSFHLRASLLESIAVLTVSPSLKYLPIFPSGYHPVFLLPTSYILLSGFTCPPPICSSFTHNQPSDFITFMNCLTIRSPLPLSLANSGSIFQFIFLNISATLDSLNHHSLSFLKCVTLLSSRRVCVPWPPPPLWFSSFAFFMGFPSTPSPFKALPTTRGPTQSTHPGGCHPLTF